MARVSFALITSVGFVPTSSEVQFNCPWCNTRLALKRKEFETERAVMCPRCNQPVDLEIQRKLVKPAPPAGRPGAATPEAKRRAAPLAPPVALAPAQGVQAQAPAADQGAPPDQPDRKTRPWATGPPAPLEPIRTADIDAAFGSDATRLGDVDALTGGRAPIRSKPLEQIGSGTTPSSQTGMGAKLKCPSCNYENAPVPPEFSFGTVQKCSWCGKPLPK